MAVLASTGGGVMVTGVMGDGWQKRVIPYLFIIP
jgi:hypothetical protein